MELKIRNGSTITPPLINEQKCPTQHNSCIIPRMVSLAVTPTGDHTIYDFLYGNPDSTINQGDANERGSSSMGQYTGYLAHGYRQVRNDADDAGPTKGSN